MEVTGGEGGEGGDADSSSDSPRPPSPPIYTIPPSLSQQPDDTAFHENEAADIEAYTHDVAGAQGHGAEAQDTPFQSNSAHSPTVAPTTSPVRFQESSAATRANNASSKSGRLLRSLARNDSGRADGFGLSQEEEDLIREIEGRDQESVREGTKIERTEEDDRMIHEMLEEAHTPDPEWCSSPLSPTAAASAAAAAAAAAASEGGSVNDLGWQPVQGADTSVLGKRALNMRPDIALVGPGASGEPSGTTRVERLVEEWDGDYEGEDVEAHSCVLLCGGLSLRHPLRRTCLNIWCSRLANLVFLLANLACCSLLALAPDLFARTSHWGATARKEEDQHQLIDGRNFDNTSPILRIVEVAYLGMLLLEMTVGLVALGFLGRGGWLRRSNFHVLDVAIFCLSILDLGMRTFSGLSLIPVHSLRFLRIFKSVFRLSGFSAGRALLRSLGKAASQLLLVLGLVLIFFLGFAAYGISSFQFNLSLRCVHFERVVPSCASSDFGPWAPPCNPRRWWAQVTDLRVVPALTGGFPFEKACTVYHTGNGAPADAKLPRDPDGFLHTCQLDKFRAGESVTQMCVPFQNPGSGFAHFDHLGGAFLAVATSAILPESSGMLHIALESYAGEGTGTWPVVYLFFLFIALLCNYFLFGLFVVIVSGTYNSAAAHNFEAHAQRLRRRRKRQAFRKRVRELESAAKGVDIESEGGVGGATGMQETTDKEESHDELEESLERESSDSEEGVTVGNKSRHAGFWKGRPPPPPSLHWAASDTGRDQLRKETTPGCMRTEGWLEHQACRHFVAVVICLQATVTGVTQDRLWAPNYIIQCACTGIFALEALFRLASGRAKPLDLQYVIECAGIIIGILGLVMRQRIYVVAPAIFRVYRLMSYFPTLENLMQSTVLASHGLLQLLLILLLSIISAAVIGRYLVNATMEGRDHFATLPHSLRTAFIIFSGDNWAEVMFDAMASKTTAFGQSLVAGYFLLWISFSAFILFNLAVAIIINHFKISKLVDVIEGPGLKMSANEMVRKSWARFYKLNQKSSGVFHSNNVALDPSLDHSQSSEHHDICEVSAVHCRGGEKLLNVKMWKEAGIEGERIPSLLAAMVDALQKQDVDDGQDLNERNDTCAEIHCSEKKLLCKERRGPANNLKSGRQAAMKGQQSVFLSHEQPFELLKDSQVLELRHDHSYFLFSSQNRVRKTCIYVYNTNFFKLLVMSAVLTTCFLVAVLPANAGLASPEEFIPVHVGFILNRICLVIFTVEFLTKSIGNNLFIGPRAYLNSGWNQLDFCILALDLVAAIGALSTNSWGFAAGRAVRVLSVMRAVSRNEGIRVLMEALLRTLVPIAYVLVFQLLNTLLWAFLAKELFAARLHSCSGPGAEYPAGKAMCSGSFVSLSNEAAEFPVLMPRAWIRPQLHFDSMYDAFLTMLSCSALQWVEIMHNCVDITAQDISPAPDANWQAATFFVAWLLFSHFLIINLFLAFIVEGFKANDGLTDADAHMNRYLRQIKVAYFSLHIETTALKNPASRALHRMISSAAFENFSALCIVLNVICVLADHANKPAEFEDFLQLAGFVFWLLLCGEMLLHLLAQGPSCFVTSYWMLFDLCITIGISAAYASGSSMAMRRAQCVRLVRILKVLAKFKHSRVVVETLLICLPQLGNVIGLLMIGLYFFAILGVSWFGQTRQGKRLGRTSNFSSFTESANTLFQLLLTGDDWQILMHDCMVQPPYCTADVQGVPSTDCGWPFAPVYFVAFRWLCESLILNLLIGITFNNFTFLTDDVNHVETPDWREGASLRQVIDAAKAFRSVDRSRGFIPLTSLRRLLYALPQPLGFRKPDGGVEYEKCHQITYLFIRAELNLLALQNAQDAAKHARGLLGKPRQMLANSVGISVLEANERAVSYTQVMVALWCWQKPNFVSALSCRQRRRFLHRIYATANALRLASFLRNLVAERQKRYFHAHLEWSQSDAAYKRRAYLRRIEQQRHAPLLARAQQGSARKVSRAQIQARQRAGSGDEKNVAGLCKATGIALRNVKGAPRQMIAQHRLVENRWRAETTLQESGCEVATDQHLRDKALQFFLDQAERVRVVLRVIDKSDLDGATFLADLSAYSWNGWAVRGRNSIRVPGIVTETALKREGFVAEGSTGNDRTTDGGKEGISVNRGGQGGSHGAVDGREDGRRVEVCIDASNRAMERAQGQNHTGREDLEDKDTWFDPLCGTIRRATRLARLQRRFSRRVEPSNQNSIGQESFDLLQLWVPSGVKGMKLLGTLTDLQCFCTIEDKEKDVAIVEELLNYGALPPVAPQSRRVTVIRLNLSRPAVPTVVPASTSGTRLVACPSGSYGGINVDRATANPESHSSDALEAAQTLVMEVLGYCDQPEGLEDHVIDEELGPQVAAAAVTAFSSAVRSIFVGQPGEMVLDMDGTFVEPRSKPDNPAKETAGANSTPATAHAGRDEPGGVLYQANFSDPDQEGATIVRSGLALCASAFRLLYIGPSDQGFDDQDKQTGKMGVADDGRRCDRDDDAAVDAETRFLLTHGIKQRADAVQLIFSGIKGEMDPASIEAVCRFLKSELQLDDGVVSRFRVQNVDAHVVCACSPDELTVLGINTLGHQKKLLSFCNMALKREKELKYFGTPAWHANISPPKLSPPKYHPAEKGELPQHSPPHARANNVPSLSPKSITWKASPPRGGEGGITEANVQPATVAPPPGVPPGLVSSAQPTELVARPPATPRPLHAFPNASPTPPKVPYKFPGRSPSSLRSHSVLGHKERSEEGAGQVASLAAREAYFGQHEEAHENAEAGKGGNVGAGNRREDDDADKTGKRSYLGKFEEGVARKIGVIFPITEEDGRSGTTSTGQMSSSRSGSDAAGGRGNGGREGDKGRGTTRDGAIDAVDANYLDKVMERAGSQAMSSFTRIKSATSRTDGISAQANEGVHTGEAEILGVAGPFVPTRGLDGGVGRGRVAGKVAGSVTPVPPAIPPPEASARPRRMGK